MLAEGEFYIHKKWVGTAPSKLYTMSCSPIALMLHCRYLLMLRASKTLALSPAVDTSTAVIYLNCSSLSSIRDRRGERILWSNINLGWTPQQKEARSAEEGELGADGKGQEPEQYRQGGGRRMRETESYSWEASLPSKLH